MWVCPNGMYRPCLSVVPPVFLMLGNTSAVTHFWKALASGLRDFRTRR